MAIRNSAISLRLSDADRAKLRVLADRLAVREADVMRYAIDIVMARLGPLLDPAVAGPQLLPVFVESGTDLMRFFSIDSSQLDGIINSGVDDPDERVELRDIALLASSSRDEPVATVQLRALFGASDGNEEGFSRLKRRFKDYLYHKYLFRPTERKAASA
ncbi:MAG: hypothetical protein AAFM91_04925 [Pseudomonadota bacterium]